MPLPSSRDRAQLQQRLDDWLATKLPSTTQPKVSEIRIPEGTGMSSETLMFDATWREDGRERVQGYVVRMSPDMDDYPVFPVYNLEQQFRILNLVRRHTRVPVPETPWLELDESHLGSSFFVMHRVDGKAPPDVPPYVFGGWLSDASAQQRARLQRASVNVLTELHAVDPRRVDVSFLERPEFGATALDQHLGYQRYYYDWARRGASYSIIERTLDWLDAHRPSDEGERVINWGDSRIGNILYRDFEPVAVLDWEMAALGAPEADLAWMLFMHDFFADLARKAGLPGLPGFLARDHLVATYEGLSGRRVRDLQFYEVFAALRYGIISIPIGLRSLAYGAMDKPDDPEDIIMIRGLLEQMLDGSYWER